MVSASGQSICLHHNMIDGIMWNTRQGERSHSKIGSQRD
jgi:hypothetical protein